MDQRRISVNCNQFKIGWRGTETTKRSSCLCHALCQSQYQVGIRKTIYPASQNWTVVYVESEIDLDHILRDKGISRSLKFSEQNRGYSIYYHSNSEFGSVVHGNFGGITKDLKKTARKTLLSHVYTPIYKFEKLSNYDLVFNNPTSSSIIIKIFFNNSSRIIDLIIPSLGTRFLRIKNYSGSCSFESRLPICRALVFKNPTPNFSGTFDIFHS